MGDLRFRRTRPPKPWEDVRDACAWGSKPLQPISELISNPDIGESEDCLYLNVWSKGADDKKRPVMVWIYGGGFVQGEASFGIFDGERFAMDGDVVFVSFNYRLGLWGFCDFSRMSGARGRFDSNCGLCDQIMALSWVHGNISAFGGDPQT